VARDGAAYGVVADAGTGRPYARCRGRTTRRVLAAVLCATAALTGRPATAAGSPGSYGYDKGDRVVDGATGTADAVDLDPGGTYRSSLPKGARLYYGLDLDATSTSMSP
jgi:hypothetical protein